MDRFRGGLALNAHGELRFYVSSVAFLPDFLNQCLRTVIKSADVIPPDRSGSDVFIPIRVSLGAANRG